VKVELDYEWSRRGIALGTGTKFCDEIVALVSRNIDNTAKSEIRTVSAVATSSRRWRRMFQVRRRNRSNQRKLRPAVTFCDDSRPAEETSRPRRPTPAPATRLMNTSMWKVVYGVLLSAFDCNSGDPRARCRAVINREVCSVAPRCRGRRVRLA